MKLNFKFSVDQKNFKLLRMSTSCHKITFYVFQILVQPDKLWKLEILNNNKHKYIKVCKVLWDRLTILKK